VRADKAALQELLAMGFNSTPVIVIGGEAIAGFDQAKIAARLGL
jgi:protein-disulfide isomerase